MSAITRFVDEYAFLSNFYPSPIVLPNWHPAADCVAPTIEHAFQAAKTDSVSQAQAIVECSSPGTAKRLGRRVVLRPGWDSGRKVIMVGLLRVKFAPGSSLADMLLQTSHAYLVEGNTWGDRYWGVCDGVGCNWLGRCLMLVRAELDVMPEYTNLPRVGQAVTA